ncbi:CAP domain-containing protein, partial [Dietzia sp. SLG510A3-40A3]|nr:CAP domain-containing protein [Dietzia sp. SLG510A3-40A3]
MASPGHRVNLLNPGHTSMGVGAAVAADGKLYATQVFARY